MRLFTAVAFLCSLISAGNSATAAEKSGKISFKRTQLDSKFRSEGVAVGDFNHDGAKTSPPATSTTPPPIGRCTPSSRSPRITTRTPTATAFATWADDLNGDGWTDLLVVDFPGQQTWWFENPQTAAGPWKRHVVTPVTNNESPTYLDVDGDGRRELVLGYSLDPANPDGPDRWLGIARRTSDPSALWTLQAISAKGCACTGKFVHGLGVGDINQGRPQRRDRQAKVGGKRRRPKRARRMAVPSGRPLARIGADARL